MKVRTAILLTITGELLIAVFGILNNGFTVEGLQTTTRWSGRFSLFLFSVIFLLYPARKAALARYMSAGFFLVFALAHGIHLLELLTYVYLSGTELVPYRLAGGFVAYLMIFAMPWFQYQFDSAQLTLRRFQMLGWVYLFYVWFIFFMTYIGRLTQGFPNSSGSRSWQVILMSWVCAMAVIKTAGFFIKERATTVNHQP